MVVVYAFFSIVPLNNVTQNNWLTKVSRQDNYFCFVPSSIATKNKIGPLKEVDICF